MIYTQQLKKKQKKRVLPRIKKITFNFIQTGGQVEIVKIKKVKKSIQNKLEEYQERLLETKLWKSLWTLVCNICDTDAKKWKSHFKVKLFEKAKNVYALLYLIFFKKRKFIYNSWNLILKKRKWTNLHRQIIKIQNTIEDLHMQRSFPNLYLIQKN